jgi:hypothetical protein
MRDAFRAMLGPATALALLLVTFSSRLGAQRDSPAVVGPKHVDAEGFLLPAEAIARVGSARFRTGAAITSLAYSADDKIIAALGYRSAQLWDSTRGQPRCEFKQDAGSGWAAMALHPRQALR